MCEAPTSVHPPETNVEAADDAHGTSSETYRGGRSLFLHSGWHHDRERVHIAFLATGQANSRIQAFDTCGSHAWLAQNKDRPNEFCVTTDRCHDRFCTPCANAQAARVARGLAQFAKLRTLRFITLTLRTNGEPLRDSLDRLVAAFRKLRQREFWKRHVVGGAAFLEVKWNETATRWHPHLHILAEGRYLDQSILRTEWNACTGDSWIVDVRAVKDKARTLDYVAKYATKGYDHSVFDTPATLNEAIVALHGRRLMMCFKSWRGFKLADDDNDEHWEPLAPMTDIFRHADANEPWAVAILEHLRNPNEVPSPGPPPEHLIRPVVAACSRGSLASRESHLVIDTRTDHSAMAREYIATRQSVTRLWTSEDLPAGAGSLALREEEEGPRHRAASQGAEDCRGQEPPPTVAATAPVSRPPTVSRPNIPFRTSAWGPPAPTLPALVEPVEDPPTAPSPTLPPRPRFVPAAAAVAAAAGPNPRGGRVRETHQ